MPTFCVDLDGTLISWGGFDSYSANTFGKPFPGAKRFLQLLKSLGTIIIHTARCNSEEWNEPIEQQEQRVRNFLDKHNIPYDSIWTGRGKPVADFYVDDRAVTCKPNEKNSVDIFRSIYNHILSSLHV